MAFRSTQLYTRNKELQSDIDHWNSLDHIQKKMADDKARGGVDANLDGIVDGQKKVWANGLGDNVVGKYDSWTLPDHLRFSEENVSDLDRQGIRYQQFKQRQDYDAKMQQQKLYGYGGAPTFSSQNSNTEQMNNSLNNKPILDPIEGNSSPFSENTQLQANSVYGNTMERTAAVNVNNPALAMKGSPVKIDPPSAYDKAVAPNTYNALEVLGSVNSLGLNSSSSNKGGYSTDKNPMNSSLPLPGLPTSSTGNNSQGNYANPAKINLSNTSSNNENSSSPGGPGDGYSFLDNNLNNNKVNNNITNKFRDPYWGTYKKDTQTYTARVKDATDKGQLNKAARIQKRYDKWKARQTGTGSGVGNLLRSINIFKTKKKKKNKTP